MLEVLDAPHDGQALFVCGAVVLLGLREGPTGIAHCFPSILILSQHVTQSFVGNTSIQAERLLKSRKAVTGDVSFTLRVEKASWYSSIQSRGWSFASN